MYLKRRNSAGVLAVLALMCSAKGATLTDTLEVPSMEILAAMLSRLEATAEAHAANIARLQDTVAALNHAASADDFTFVSTAGGAFLEWMEGKELPGVAALRA